jgi:hypothetical protein
MVFLLDAANVFPFLIDAGSFHVRCVTTSPPCYIKKEKPQRIKKNQLLTSHNQANMTIKIATT